MPVQTLAITSYNITSVICLQLYSGFELMFLNWLLTQFNLITYCHYSDTVSGSGCNSDLNIYVYLSLIAPQERLAKSHPHVFRSLTTVHGYAPLLRAHAPNHPVTRVTLLSHQPALSRTWFARYFRATPVPHDYVIHPVLYSKQ